MSSSFDLPAVDRITVGTVGEPGERTFYLQGREDDQVVTLKLEKTQVGALAERLGELLRDNPPATPVPDAAALDLEPPVLAEWVVGSLGLSFDETDDLVVLVCEEAVVIEADELEEGLDPERLPSGAVARFGATRAQMAALAIRGATLVASGRPPCPLCGYPLDPNGHVCPKTNGHRAPTL